MVNTTTQQEEKYLKWNNDVIGVIDLDYNVRFTQPKYNDVVYLYTRGKDSWSRDEFISFLSERLVSKERRDIEKILFRCGLSRYDILRLSLITKSIHPKDLIWIAEHEEDKFEEAITDVFNSIFAKRVDAQDDSVNSPEGYNIKRYGVYEGKYGIYKQRISPLITDVESEVAVYKLAQRLGVDCCPAYKIDDNNIFSEFVYDFADEYIIHFRRMFDGIRSDNEYKNLTEIRPQYKEDIIKMLILDFITRQDDRHLSNIAIKVSKEGESFYPLYDNGRSLFYEDTEEFVQNACKNVPAYATSFGYSGTYYDYLKEISEQGVKLSQLVNLNISDEEIEAILKESDFKGYRLEGAKCWIREAIEIVKDL